MTRDRRGAGASPAAVAPTASAIHQTGGTGGQGDRRRPGACPPRAFILLLAALTACTPAPKTESAPPQYFKPDPATAGTVRGVVRFTGSKPAAKRISMDAEEACEKMQTKPVYAGEIVTGKGGTLADAFVYVKSGLEGKTFEPANQSVVLDQRACQFVPRVVALRAGQTLAVKNSDPVSHNIHPQPKSNYEWNQQQSPGAPDLQRRFARPEVLIPVKCNIHAWMRSYIAVLDHPYFAVTKPDGAFEWQLPPGEYTIAAWHESIGELTENVVVKQGTRSDLAVTFTVHANAR